MKLAAMLAVLGLVACDTVGTQPGAAAAYEGLVINEVAAAGRPHDWFELYNASDRAISLDGVTFSDHPKDPKRRALLPHSAVVLPGAYLVIRLPGAAGFRLGAGEALALFAPDGTALDAVDWSEGDASSGRSLARVKDGEGEFVAAARPTPGRPNEVEPWRQSAAAQDVE